MPSNNTAEITKILLASGAEINRKNYFSGKTALHYACESDNVEFVRALIDNVDDVNKINYYQTDFNLEIPGGGGRMAARPVTGVQGVLARGQYKQWKKIAHGAKTLNGQAVLHQLAIIGGGPAGVSLFIALVKNMIADSLLLGGRDYLKKHSLVLIDRRKNLGTGTPYSEELNADTSVLNVAASSMSLVADESNDFVEWIKDLDDKGELKNRLGKAYKMGVVGGSVDPNGFYPRLFFGQYAKERVAKWVKIAQDAGIHVTVLSQAEVIKEVPAAPGKSGLAPLMLQIKNLAEPEAAPQELEATQCFYAVGHWQELSDKPKPYEETDAYIPFPMNFEELDAKGIFKQPKEIAILGSSLSAIDAIFTILLHPKVGKLTWDDDGNVRYTLFDKRWKVATYSRRGLFPRVRPLQNADLDFKYLSMEKVQRRLNNGRVSFSKVMDLFNREFTHQLGRPIDVRQEIDPLQSRPEYKKDPFKIIEKDIERAVVGDGRTPDKAYVAWWLVGSGMLGAIRLLFSQFTAEERKEYYNKYNSQTLWAVAPMPLRSAKILMAMHKAGALNARVVVGAPAVAPDDRTLDITYRDQEGSLQVTNCDYLLGTIGLGSKFYLDESALTQGLQADDRLSFTAPTATADTMESHAFISDDGTFELLDRNKEHAPDRRGVGYFLQAQLFDLQSVPGVLKYAKVVAKIYAAEFAYSVGEGELWRKESKALDAFISSEGLSVSDPGWEPNPGGLVEDMDQGDKDQDAQDDLDDLDELEGMDEYDDLDD
ncbi:FAD/NAD(P)-binding protein [Sneathiella marina]